MHIHTTTRFSIDIHLTNVSYVEVRNEQRSLKPSLWSTINNICSLWFPCWCLRSFFVPRLWQQRSDHYGHIWIIKKFLFIKNKCLALRRSALIMFKKFLSSNVLFGFIIYMLNFGDVERNSGPPLTYENFLSENKKKTKIHYASLN